MAKRKIVKNKKIDSKIFTKTANKTKAINIYPVIKYGGERM